MPNRDERRKAAKSNGKPMAPGVQPAGTAEPKSGPVAIANKSHHYRLVPAGEARQITPDGSTIHTVLFHLISPDGNLLVQTQTDPDGEPQPIVISSLPYVVEGSGILRNPFMPNAPLPPGSGPKLIQ